MDIVLRYGQVPLLMFRLLKEMKKHKLNILTCKNCSYYSCGTIVGLYQIHSHCTGLYQIHSHCTSLLRQSVWPSVATIKRIHADLHMSTVQYRCEHNNKHSGAPIGNIANKHVDTAECNSLVESCLCSHYDGPTLELVHKVVTITFTKAVGTIHSVKFPDARVFLIKIYGCE